VQKEQARQLYRELTAVKQDSAAGHFAKFPGSWALWAYKRYLCLWNSVDATMEQLDKRVEKLDDEIEELGKQPDESTGNAIIVFNWATDAANMLYDHNMRNAAANLFVPPGLGRSLNVLTRGMFARTPKVALTRVENGKRTTLHRHVSVARAPEPSDLMWENTLFGGWPIVRRRVLAWVAYTALLCVAFAVQVILQYQGRREAESRLNRILDPTSDDSRPTDVGKVCPHAAAGSPSAFAGATESSALAHRVLATEQRCRPCAVI
jgi:hypothetical protein